MISSFDNFFNIFLFLVFISQNSNSKLDILDVTQADDLKSPYNLLYRNFNVLPEPSEENHKFLKLVSKVPKVNVIFF